MVLVQILSMKEGEKFEKPKLQEENGLGLEIVSKNQSPYEEFVARDYQSEILERAKKENIIAYLGTGTGKTYIAVMLMKHYLYETRSDYNGEGKRTVFLVPTVPLVRQQANVIRRHIPDAKVGEHFGEMTVELNNKDRWQKEIEDKNIFVMVAEEFRLLIHHAFIPISKINLIVIDECHRAAKNHPYREAMKCFDNCDIEKRSRVLGLTASLVNTKCKPSKLEQNIIALERTLYSTVVTPENSEAMKSYGTDPKECEVTYCTYKNNNEIFTQVIKVLMDAVMEFSKDFDDIENDDLIFYTQPRKCVSNILHVATSLGPWCTFHSAKVMLDEIHKISRKEDNASVLKKLDEILKVVYNLCKLILKDENSAFIFSSPKLRKLLDILFTVNHLLGNKHDNFQGNASALCGIIFVKQRLFAYVLHSWLNVISKSNEDYTFLKTNFVVGHGQQQQQAQVPFSKLSSLSHKKQEKVIKDFRAKKYNFLISTSVLEEGIDVPKCNVVIRFDLPEDYRAYIQSKGRARAADAMYILMVSESEQLKFIENLTDFRAIQKILSTFCRGRQQPTEEESFEANNCDEILPPYMPVKKDGAPRITMSSAIALINRYCSTLPCDKSSRLVPRWKTENKPLKDSVSLGTICTLYLPVNSAVKEPVTGPVMQNKRLAKMAAALKMCEKLHIAGELDKNLLPIGNKVDKYILEILGDTKNEISGSPNKEKRCLYEKEIPDILQQNLFEEKRIHCLLYSIELSFSPDCDITKLKEYEKIEGPHNFGILTTKPLPQLCTFPIFSQKAGLKINVKIDIASSDLYFDDIQLNNILSFHQYIFSDVIQLGKGRLQFDPENSKFRILVVPIIKDDSSMKYHLDWVLISTICEHCCLGKDQLKEMNRKLMKPESYESALIYPWHYVSCKEKIYFYVQKIEQDMTPESAFPDGEYSNYIDYFDKKYGVKIMKSDQFLLYVNPISSSLPTEKSRYEDQYGKPHLKQTKQIKRKSIRLPPELCIISPVPFSLYRKALSLPAVLYRMSSLLRAEQLRVAVAKDVGIGLSDIGKEFKWIGFDFGEDYLKMSAMNGHSSLYFEHNQNSNMSSFKSSDLKAPSIKIGSNFVSKINLDYQVSLVNHPGPSLGMILTALTLRGANDGINLERLEVVGDSFLKYAISAFLHCTYKDLDEGKLTTLKSYLIRNSYLLHLGKKKQLHRLITAVKYEGRGNWVPPFYIVSCSEQTQQKSCNKKSCFTKEQQHPIRYTKQRISDKSIADCVEALIGAYLLSCGQYGALKFMSWLGMKVFNNCIPIEPCLTLGNYPWLTYPVQEPCHISLSVEYLQYKTFQEKVGYTFKNEMYLLEAFTHATFNPPFNHPYKTDCYQRLEFLGDAILDYIVIRYLYEDPKNHSPGALTDIRAALVNNHFFATLAAKYDYHQYIRYDSASLFQLIDKFVDKATSEEIDVGQCSYDIEEAETDDLAEIDVPKALADVFESVAGAIYLDSGMLLEEVWKVYYPMIKPGLENFCNNVPKPPVRELFESFPGRIKFNAPKLLPNRMVQVEVTIKDGGEFEGVGPNKIVAKHSAAKKALRILKNGS